MSILTQKIAPRHQPTPPLPPIKFGPHGYPECLGSPEPDDTFAADTAADRDAADMAAAYRSDRDRLIDGEWPGVTAAIDGMGVGR